MDVIEVRLTWGESVIAVAHRDPHALLRLGDFGLPIPGNDQAIVATIMNGRAVLLLPTGEVAPAGARVSHDREGLGVRISVEARPAPVRWWTLDFSMPRGLLLAALVHAAIFAIAITARAAPGEEEHAAFAVMKGYLAAIDARRDDAEAPSPEVVADVVDGETRTKPRETGVAGHPLHTNPVGTAQKTQKAQKARADLEGPNPDALDEARSFGIIALLSPSKHGPWAGTDPFASADGPSALGSIFGSTIDHAMGEGGAALSGTGEGGGGRGAGIGMDGIASTCGGNCRGTQGFGRGIGRLGRSHETRAPVLRCGSEEDPKAGCSMQVNGRLPPEAIQRVVRQNFGRFRACYEDGIRRNPQAEGRISVKFVIDRSGAVAAASASESSLADTAVTECVVRSFHALSFSEPEGGIVTVVYPLVFSAGT